jgi:hypothetical protein
LLLAGKGIVQRPLTPAARIAWAEAGSEEGVDMLVAYGIPGIPLAQDPSSWTLFGWSLLLVSLGTGIFYFFKVTNVWIRGQISTSWYVGIFGALWILICACVIGMDYLSSYVFKGAATRLSENTPRLHGSPWAYGIVIGSVAALLLTIGGVSQYQKYRGNKRGRKGAYHLRRKQGTD